MPNCIKDGWGGRCPNCDGESCLPSDPVAELERRLLQPDPPMPRVVQGGSGRQQPGATVPSRQREALKGCTMNYLYAGITLIALMACWGSLGQSFADAAAIAVVVGVPVIVWRRSRPAT